MRLSQTSTGWRCENAGRMKWEAGKWWEDEKMEEWKRCGGSVVGGVEM